MIYEMNPVTTRHETACGPACLKMLLEYYGEEAELDALIEECNARLIGCSARDLLRVGRAHGLSDMMAVKRDDAGDVLTQDRPAIIWWRYQHWIVFCGCDGDGKVVVCDPARGRYRMSAGLFGSCFAGIELTNGHPEDLPEE